MPMTGGEPGGGRPAAGEGGIAGVGRSGLFTEIGKGTCKWAVQAEDDSMSSTLDSHISRAEGLRQVVERGWELTRRERYHLTWCPRQASRLTKW
jgi:hypothetical protein